MKIIHTSDIHLKKFDDDRWNALIEILRLSKNHKIDILTIAGDLFDKNSDADLLRNKIRKIFSGNNFKILLIPGNHDYKAFSEGVYFGKDVLSQNNSNSPIFSKENIDIWALPFDPVGEAEVLRKLMRISKHIDRTKTNILIFHGELIDAFYSSGDYGEEGQSSYMPIRLSSIESLGFNYILAGHFHRSFDVRTTESGCYFVYSGSPISVTKREIGKRRVNLFEVGDEPQEYVLDTPYFQIKDYFINPSDGRDPVAIIKDGFKGEDYNSRVILTVKGYIDSRRIGINESEFYKKVDKILPDNVVEKNIDIKDVSSIFEDELYKEFNDLLERESLTNQDKNEIINLVMNAFMRLR